ncbi:hypothetical protein BKA69DRAFT_1127929 [Paraphysoderma sedebokerense]|nr:hypothetical protein BKA69DRAFT_1127929 [Paraphysoderma sedebokerense]
MSDKSHHSNDYFLLLLGKPLSSTEIACHLQEYHPNAPEIKSFSDCVFHNYKTEGISYCFDYPISQSSSSSSSSSTPSSKEPYLAAIHIYTSHQGYSPFRLEIPLPHDLRITDKGYEIVQKLGEPDKKAGGKGIINCCVVYETLGIQVEFKGKSWDDKDVEIACLTIYQGANK